MCCADVEDLAGELGDEGTDGDDYVYVGSPESLRIMSLSEPMLRQVFDRERSLQSLFFRAWLNTANSQRPEEEAKERKLKEDVTSRILP